MATRVARNVGVRWAPVGPGDLEIVADNIREADAREIWRSTGQSPLPALEFAVEASCRAGLVVIDNQVAAVCGIVRHSLLSGSGSPWAITTKIVNRYAKSLVRASRKVLYDILRPECPGRLVVEVDAEYRAAHRWLAWLGFELAPPHLNARGYPFVFGVLPADR